MLCEMESAENRLFIYLPGIFLLVKYLQVEVQEHSKRHLKIQCMSLIKNESMLREGYSYTFDISSNLTEQHSQYPHLTSPFFSTGLSGCFSDAFSLEEKVEN